MSVKSKLLVGKTKKINYNPKFGIINMINSSCKTQGEFFMRITKVGINEDSVNFEKSFEEKDNLIFIEDIEKTNKGLHRGYFLSNVLDVFGLGCVDRTGEKFYTECEIRRKNKQFYNISSSGTIKTEKQEIGETKFFCALERSFLARDNFYSTNTTTSKFMKSKPYLPKNIFSVFDLSFIYDFEYQEFEFNYYFLGIKKENQKLFEKIMLQFFEENFPIVLGDGKKVYAQQSVDKELLDYKFLINDNGEIYNLEKLGGEYAFLKLIVFLTYNKLIKKYYIEKGEEEEPLFVLLDNVEVKDINLKITIDLLKSLNSQIFLISKESNSKIKHYANKVVSLMKEK